jgi:hypothetical protein
MIEKLDFKVDLPMVVKDIETVANMARWNEDNQIGLTHRPGAPYMWKDAVGSLHNDTTKSENEFTEINYLIPLTLKQMLIDFAEFQGIHLGRVRIMRLPSKRGLTVHRDTTVRYHLVINTNIDSFFGFRDLRQVDGVAAKCYHIPADGHFYKVDTTKIHFVYNGGKTDRIHIVIVPR